MVLRNSLGANLESFISERVTPISGDVCDENLGIKDCILREEMWKEIDIVLNSAATTKFDERCNEQCVRNQKSHTIKYKSSLLFLFLCFLFQI